MYKRTSALVVYSLLASFCGNAESGPMKRSSRMVREVYPAIEPENGGTQAQVCIVGDVVYGMDETVPAEQPCLKCKCQPPGVQCETIQCVKRPGCKAIHKPNKCCPDYQCECEHNAKFYANGEKLETPPGGECKVCYCRGREIQCAEVSCYIRNDCEAKRVPGTCCPKYDNCPPIDSIPERSSYTTEMILPKPNKDPYEPWVITGLPNSTQSIPNSSSNNIPDENKIPDTHYYEATTPNYKSLEVEDLQRDSSKITIQEIIPERKEIPITAPPRVITEPQGTLIIEEAEDFSNNSNDLVVTDAEADSSEILEVFQQPPPILRIGDKLLFLKKGELVPEKDTSTPSSVITIIGAEGLQRGFEESGEVHEMKIDADEDIRNQSATSSSDKTLESADSQYLNMLVLNTAASTHILSLVKRKNYPTTTESLPPTEVRIATEGEIEAEEPSSAVLRQENENASITSTVDNDQPPSTTEIQDTLTTEIYYEVSNVTGNAPKEKSYSSTTMPKDQQETITEINPEYPPLREILVTNVDDSSQRFDIEDKEFTENITSTEPSPKIIQDVLDIISNKTVPKNSTHKDWLKSNTETLVNPLASLPEELLKQPAPTNYEDINSAELPSSTTDLTPVTNEQTHNSTIDMVVDEESETEKVSIVDSVPAEIPRSVESLEEIVSDSGESTTSKDIYASLVSDDNASVEGDKNHSEADDMVEVKEKPDQSRVENTTPHDVQIIDNVDESKKQTGVKNTDVEIIDTTILHKPNVEKSVSPISNPDVLHIPNNAIDTPLKIIKREYTETYDERDDEIEEEDEDKQRDEEIFKQLLEDTSTPKIPVYRDKETDPKEGRSAAFAQYSLRDAISDPNFIGIISNIFKDQRRP